MRQSSYSVTASQKDIFAFATDLFLNVNMKIAKTDVTGSLVDGILKAGTRMAADGKVATAGSSSAASTAYGVLVNDVDFNDSQGTEIGSVCIFGFLSEAKVKEYSGSSTITTYEKAALNFIKFI